MSTKAFPNSRPAPNVPPKLRYRSGETVKLIQVIDSQGETLDPDVNELLLRKHIGEACKVIGVGEMSVKLKLKTGRRAWAVPEEISRNMKAAINPTKYDMDAVEMADRLLDRHGGDINKALINAGFAISDAKCSGDKLHLERVYREIFRRDLASKIGANDVGDVPSQTNDDGIRPGSYCKCGGHNKDCFRCDGTGIVQETR
jgi:hypothetical protein